MIRSTNLVTAVATAAAMLACMPDESRAQGAPGTPPGVSLAGYLAAVNEHSLDLRAQQETLTSAIAAVSIAGVRPDPQLTTGIASKELSRANKPSAATALTAGVAWTIETGGKRAARIRNAQGNVLLSRAGIESFRDQMQIEAAGAFFESCRARAALALKQSSLASFRDTVKADEIRLKAGDIGLLELRQARVEAERFATDVTVAEAAAQVAAFNLSAPLGDRFETVFGNALPVCLQDVEPAMPEIDELIRQALGRRRDVLLAQASVDAARSAASLVQSNRWVDPVVNVGLTNTPRISPVFDNSGAVVNSPAGHSLSLGLTLTVPIPISRLQDGEVRQAESALTQAMLQLQSALLRAQVDVQSTQAMYRSARQIAQRYDAPVVQEADRVLEGTRFSYRRGAASLLDLLSAQRSAEDVHLARLQALADLADATVKLRLSTGEQATP